MNKIIYLFLFFLNIYNGYSQLNNYQWNTTVDTIKKMEGIPNIEDFQYLIYRNRNIENYQMDIRYYFYENELQAIDYTITGNYSIEEWIETYIYFENLINNYCNFTIYFSDEETREQLLRVYHKFQGVNISGNNIINGKLFTGYVFAVLMRIIRNYDETTIELDFNYLNIQNIFEIKIKFRSSEYNIIFDYYIHNNILYGNL